jgi:hypothetical protein
VAAGLAAWRSCAGQPGEPMNPAGGGPGPISARPRSVLRCVRSGHAHGLRKRYAFHCRRGSRAAQRRPAHRPQIERCSASLTGSGGHSWTGKAET